MKKRTNKPSKGVTLLPPKNKSKTNILEGSYGRREYWLHATKGWRSKRVS